MSRTNYLIVDRALSNLFRHEFGTYLVIAGTRARSKLAESM